MAFGQQSGSPAPARQVQELLDLVRGAGYDGFKEARHPLGLTQRQAAGRFTRDEVEALIGSLTAASEGEPTGSEQAESPKLAAARQLLRTVPAELLAAELERRGFVVVGP